MPESPFIKLVNWPTAVVAGELYVIAGDLDPDAWWAKLLVWVTDRFYSGAHDLVVNTASMYGGAKRTDLAKGSFFEGPAVNHFNYFRNSDSAARMVAAILRGDSAGFEDFEPKVVEIARAIEVRDATPRPTVFMLPGIMGSELGVKQDRIWFDIGDLLLGGMEKLAIGARNVQPLQPFARYYGDLLQFLTTSHRVIPFAYDWRTGPAHRSGSTGGADQGRAASRARTASADADPGALDGRARRAHHDCAAPGSVGADARDTGRAVRDAWHAERRLAFDHRAAGRTLQDLAPARAARRAQRHARPVERDRAISGRAGNAASDAREDYFDPAVWKILRGAERRELDTPAGADLSRRGECVSSWTRPHSIRSRCSTSPGMRVRRLCAMRIDAQEKDPARRIQFDATNRGDGRVPWEGGIPPGLKTWYMDVAHGDLSADEMDFPRSSTCSRSAARLDSRPAPPVDRAAAEVFPMPRDMEAVYPDEAGIAGRSARSEPARRVARKVSAQSAGQCARRPRQSRVRALSGRGRPLRRRYDHQRRESARPRTRWPTVAAPATRAVPGPDRVECCIRQPAFA